MATRVFDRAKTRAALLLALLVLAPVACQGVGEDPLPSWNDGPTKRAIVTFVQRVTDRMGPDYVRPEDRVAVFDNDGTLWSEQPVYFQLQFALDRVAELAPEHPEWRTTPPFSDILSGNPEAALSGGRDAIVALVNATQTGMTADDFADDVRAWAASAEHPRFSRPYTELTYEPMIELIRYLQSEGFTTWIVSGGDVAFMRPWAEDAYEIPRAQIIGSEIATRVEMRDDAPVLVRESGIAFVDDGPGKPVAIARVIGRRPLMAFGNSDGDLEMLDWTAAGEGPRFAAIVHHTDAAREWAYDRGSHVGGLDRALDAAAERGWTLIDMRDDWRRVYDFDSAAPAPARVSESTAPHAAR